MESPTNAIRFLFIVSLGLFTIESLLLVDAVIKTTSIIKESDGLIRNINPKLYELYKPALEEKRL